jgi:diaminopimelate decarboxylase
MKANSNPEILKTIKNGNEGVQNVDVVSPGEIYRALDCGFKPENILYTENFISPE